MRHAFTAVLERNSLFTAPFATEPYEVGWATEARWFVRALSLDGAGTTLRLQPQLSPDGLVWCDADCSPLELRGEGIATCAMRDFGHWLRLSVVSEDGAPVPLTRVTLALKG